MHGCDTTDDCQKYERPTQEQQPTERANEETRTFFVSAVARSLLCMRTQRTLFVCCWPLFVASTSYYIRWLFIRHSSMVPVEKNAAAAAAKFNSLILAHTHKPSSCVLKYYSMLLPYFSGWCYVSRFVGAYSLET